MEIVAKGWKELEKGGEGFRLGPKVGYSFDNFKVESLLGTLLLT